MLRNKAAKIRTKIEKKMLRKKATMITAMMGRKTNHNNGTKENKNDNKQDSMTKYNKNQQAICWLFYLFNKRTNRSNRKDD